VLSLAAYRDPMTMDDYLAARPVSTPFGLLDCDVPIDGSIALVVSHADYAADCPNPAVKVEAIGGAYGSGGWFHRDDFPKMASNEAAAEMWSRTDLTPSDVNVAEIYDGFTFLTFAWLEALGFCANGEAGPFVDGATLHFVLTGQAPTPSVVRAVRDVLPTLSSLAGSTFPGVPARLLATIDWTLARAWLHRELRLSDASAAST